MGRPNAFYPSSTGLARRSAARWFEAVRKLAAVFCMFGRENEIVLTISAVAPRDFHVRAVLPR